MPRSRQKVFAVDKLNARKTLQYKGPLSPEPQNLISALFSPIVPPALYCERSAETGRYNYLFHRLRWGFGAQVLHSC